jgi:hypothetical protein
MLSNVWHFSHPLKLLQEFTLFCYSILLASACITVKLNLHKFGENTMQIDDYRAEQALTEKIKANLPIQVFPTKELVKGLKAQGKSIDATQTFNIQDVFYSGDMGGITCALENKPEDKEAFVVSITHLKVDPDHPLASEIEAYQRQRVSGLAIQNGREFAAEVLKQRSPQTKKKNSKKGFGKSR